jgi:hypothetical protein
MSVTPLHTPAKRRVLRDLFGPDRPSQPAGPGTPTPHDATPARRVPAPRHEALAIGLGCDHLGRQLDGRRR